MSALLERQKRWSPGEVVSQWWQAWTANSSENLDLAWCATGQIDQLARDISVSASELRELARLGPGAADLLMRRMAALGLDRNEVSRAEPGTLQDLQRVCSLCEKHKQCARDMAQRSNGPAWQDYCPNVGTLRMLNAMHFGRCGASGGPMLTA